MDGPGRGAGLPLPRHAVKVETSSLEVMAETRGLPLLGAEPPERKTFEQ